MRLVRTELQVFLVKVLSETSDQTTDELPLVCVDECLNRREIRGLCRELLTSGITGGCDSLWYQLRRHQDGTHSLLHGGGKPSVLPPGYELGLPVKRWKWPDRKVAEALVVRFACSDRLVFLSENTRLDRDGIRRILRDEVAEALAVHNHGRFALLSIFKRGKTPISRFVASVRDMLRMHVFQPGFDEELI
jgi:hypothetical protein